MARHRRSAQRGQAHPRAPAPEAAPAKASRPEPWGSTAQAAQRPSSRLTAPAGKEARWLSPLAHLQTALTFSSSVFEAAFLASDFDRVA